MADEQVTDATNSAAAIQTDAAAATDTTSSTTGETQTPDASQPEATNDDPLDEAGGLAAAPDVTKPDGESGEEGEPQGDEDGKEGEDEAPALTGAPEGDYELALPEGVSLDTDALAEIAPLAKELNLSNAGLSRLAADAMPIAERMFAKGQVEAVVAQRRAWETDARAVVQGGKLSDGTVVEPSPIYAGDNMDAVMSTAARAIDRFTSDASGQPLLFPNAKVNKETGEPEAGTFREFLATTGLGNHPALQQFAYLAGKSIAEDTDFERPGATPATKLSREEKYYPHQRTT